MNSISLDIGNTQDQLQFYLDVAAKIVETVAFEVAHQTSPQKVEELLGLACEIENAAGMLEVEVNRFCPRR